jgi:hypothetical protein
MRKAHRSLGLGAALALVAGGLLAMVTPTVASAAPTAQPCTVSVAQVNSTARSMGIGGVISAAGTSSTCQDPPPPPEPAFNGTPPLLFHGRPPVCSFSPCDFGDVLSTRQTGPLVIVPIFWAPPTYSFSTSYENIINSYIRDVAAASFQLTNVYSVATEYYGNNGQIRYHMVAGPSINATNAITGTSCDLTNADKTGIYADGTGYSACVDDAQLQAEVDSVTASADLPHNLSYMYELFLPKGVEGCFNPGSTTSTAGGQFCTINHEPTAAYCAYHSTDLNSAVYSSMNYPIYHSPIGFTCGTDARFPTEESPNGNVDADTEISPLSHETTEATTDPDTETGWFDSSGFENGDECAYIFGRTHGAPGALYNQTINGQHFITQEEFSNRVFSRSNGTEGCVQNWLQEFIGPGL